MTLTVRTTTAGEASHTLAPQLTSARTTRLSPPWMARLAEEFLLHGCAVFYDAGADAPWQLVVSFPKDRPLRLVWCDRVIVRGPLAVRVDSPLALRERTRIHGAVLSHRDRGEDAPWAAEARAAGFVPVLAIHAPNGPERELWRLEVL